MGAVFRARHLESGATHAVKVIALQPGADAERALARFRREVEVLARIAPHPHVVPIHACGVDRGVSWCAMGLVPGQSLGEHLRRGALPIEAAVAVARKIADAVEHVHAHGVLHRDIKPENVIIDELGEPRLVDFGLAADARSHALTSTGQCIGTPSFMAPEQVGAADGPQGTTAATDVYGIGALLYTAVTATPPFTGDAAVHVVAQVLRAAPDPLGAAREDAPAALDAICQKALAKAPADRYPSAGALAEDLRRFAAGESISATGSRGSGIALPRSRAARLALTLLLASLVVAFASAVVILAPRESPEALLDRVEGELLRGDALEPAAREAVAGLAAGDGPFDDRAETCRLVDLLLRADPTEARHLHAASALAAHVRRHGELARDELTLAAKALHRGRRLGALAELLHGDEPIEPASFELAPDLARAIATPGDAADAVLLRAPLDAGAFAALRRASGIDDATRGRLYRRRAETLLGSERWSAALEDLAAASSFGEALPRGSLPVPFVQFFTEHFVERLEARAPAEELRTLTDVLVASGRADVLIADEVHLAFRREANAEDRTAGEGPERLLEALVVAMALRFRTRVSPEEDAELSLGADELGRIAAAERARPVGRRNVARLLVLAIRLSRVGSSKEARATFEAALEVGLDEAWFHACVAMDFRGHDQAWASAERALALDRTQPVIMRNAHVPLALSERSTDPRERVALAAEALAWHHPYAEHWRALERKKTARDPVRLTGARAIVRALTRAIVAFVEAEGDSCCSRPTSPTVDALLDEAVGLLESGAIGLDRLLQEGDRFVEPYEARADHHRRHGRREAAVADYGLAIGFIEGRWDIPEIEKRLREKRRTLDAEGDGAGGD